MTSNYVLSKNKRLMNYLFFTKVNSFPIILSEINIVEYSAFIIFFNFFNFQFFSKFFKNVKEKIAFSYFFYHQSNSFINLTATVDNFQIQIVSNTFKRVFKSKLS